MRSRKQVVNYRKAVSKSTGALLGNLANPLPGLVGKTPQRFHPARGAVGQILHGGLAALYEAAQERHGHQMGLLLLFLKYDLGKGHRGEVLAAIVVDYFDLVAAADQTRNLPEGHVTRVRLVVELAVGVALYNPFIRRGRHMRKLQVPGCRSRAASGTGNRYQRGCQQASDAVCQTTGLFDALGALG